MLPQNEAPGQVFFKAAATGEIMMDAVKTLEGTGVLLSFKKYCFSLHTFLFSQTKGQKQRTQHFFFFSLLPLMLPESQKIGGGEMGRFHFGNLLGFSYCVFTMKSIKMIFVGQGILFR